MVCGCGGRGTQGCGNRVGGWVGLCMHAVDGYVVLLNSAWPHMSQVGLCMHAVDGYVVLLNSAWFHMSRHMMVHASTACFCVVLARCAWARASHLVRGFLCFLCKHVCQ
jgi:hypothetical protein